MRKSDGEHTGHCHRGGGTYRSGGRQHPLAVASLEDKIVQRAVVAVLKPMLQGRLPRVLVRVPTKARTARCAGCSCCRDHHRKGELILDADTAACPVRVKQCITRIYGAGEQIRKRQAITKNLIKAASHQYPRKSGATRIGGLLVDRRPSLTGAGVFHPSATIPGIRPALKPRC